MLVLLDSSMLMIPLEKKINLSSEFNRILTVSFEIVVPQIVLVELEKLRQKSQTVLKRKAIFAINLAKSFRSLESQIEGYADSELIHLAEIHNAIVATNDRELRSKLLAKGLPVISLYGDNKLTLFGDIEYQ